MSNVANALECSWEIERLHSRYETIMQNGSRDRYWPDGIVLNQIRGSWGMWQSQMLMQGGTVKYPLPPKVPDNYMVPGGWGFEKRCAVFETIPQFCPLVFILGGDADD